MQLNYRTAEHYWPEARLDCTSGEFITTYKVKEGWSNPQLDVKTSEEHPGAEESRSDDLTPVFLCAELCLLGVIMTLFLSKH